MSLSMNVREQVLQISELLDNIIDRHIDLNKVHCIRNDKQLNKATSDLENDIFKHFRKKYKSIKGFALYKTDFLNVLRDKQDAFLAERAFANILNDVAHIDGQADKGQPYFLAIIKYCEMLEGTNLNTILQYLIKTKAVLNVWHTINRYYLGVITRKSKNIMIPEQKNAILKYLIDNQDEGTLDGETIAKELNVNVRHVMDLIKEFELRDYIYFTGMARYYFEVTVKLAGEEFYENGGYVTKKAVAAYDQAAQFLSSSNIGNHNNIIIGSQNTQTINQHIVKEGNFDSLKELLKNNHVTEQEVAELQTVIDNDMPDKINKTFGSKVNGWIKNMLGKSVDATWKVGISVAGKLLSDAIQEYYGMKH